MYYVYKCEEYEPMQKVTLEMESKKSFSVTFVSALLLVLCSPTFSNYEFEGGIIMWRAIEPYSNNTEIEISQRFTEQETCSIGQLNYINERYSYSSYRYLYCRTGCSGSISYRMSFYCYDNIPGLYGTGGRSYTYYPSVSSLEASYRNGYWINLQRVGSGADWELRMKYKYIRRSGKMNSSPVTAMAEVVGVQYGCTYTIKIPVADYDGDNVKCRWASSGLGECNEVCQALPGSFLNERKCELLYNSRGQRTGYYAVAIQIEDFASSTDTAPLSSIPLQFLVKVISVGSCGQEPWIVDATLPDGAVRTIYFGILFSYYITAQARYSSSITAILATITPFGIQLQKSNLTRGDDNQWSVRISWTPSESDIGSHMLCYYAMDSNGLTSNQSCVTLVVQRDVDECALLLDDCTQVCINTIGSYECGCREGYKLHSDGRTCVGVLLHFETSQRTVKEDSVYFIVYLVPTLGHGKVLNNLTVNLLYLDNTAELGIDYQPVDYVAHFTANTTKSSPIRINIIDDNGWEESETFTISFTIPDGVDALKGEPEEAIITILDNDEAEVHFSTDQITIAPGATQQGVQLVTKQTLLSSVVLTISCFEFVPDDDLNNFERNYFKTNSTNCITSDNGIKYKVTFAKHASSSSNAMVAIPDHAKCVECVIGQPEVRGLKRVCPAVMHMNVPVQGSTYIEFGYKDYYGKEGESVVIGLHASQPILRKFRVTVSVLKFDGTDSLNRATAVNGIDYEPPSNVSRGEVRFDPSLGLNSTHLEFFLNDDGVVESTEYFVLTFTINSYLQSLGILPGPRNETIVAIEDDDGLYLQFQYATYDVNESDILHVRLEVLQLDPLIDNVYCPAKHSIQISVFISTIRDSAENGTDYIEKTERVRFFPGDQYSTEMDIVIVDDDIAEPKEMFYLRFDLPEGLEKRVKLLNNYVPVVIEDDELLEIKFANSSYLLTEDGALLFVQLIMNGTTSLPVNISVTVKPSDGTAKEFLDYFADGIQNVAVFQPNTTVSSVATIHIINDNFQEDTESFYLTLEMHNNTSEELSFLSLALPTTVTILDDDHEGTALSVDFEYKNLSGREGTVLNVTVIRRGRLSQKLAVPVTEQTITARPGVDYILQTPFVVFSSLKSMEEKHNVMVKLLRDKNREGPELFLLYLHPQPGVQSTKQEAIITIFP